MTSRALEKVRLGGKRSTDGGSYSDASSSTFMRQVGLSLSLSLSLYRSTSLLSLSISLSFSFCSRLAFSNRGPNGGWPSRVSTRTRFSFFLGNVDDFDVDGRRWTSPFFSFFLHRVQSRRCLLSTRRPPLALFLLPFLCCLCSLPVYRGGRLLVWGLFMDLFFF